MTETMTATLPAYQYHDLQLTDYHISKTILQMFTLYILSSNKSIRRSHLMNLSTLLNSYDPNGYKSDPEKIEMIEFVKRGLDARLNFNLSDPQLILFHINGSITDDDDVSNYRELSSSDIQWLNQMVSDTINQAHVFHETDRMIDICTRFQLAAPGAEKAALRALKLCQKRGYKTDVEICVHRGNIDTLPQTIEALCSVGVQNVRVGNVAETALWNRNCDGNAMPYQEYLEKMIP